MTQGFDLYSDAYYESLNGTLQDAAAVAEPIKSYGSASTFIRGCLVLLLRAGFVLVQLGSVPTENVYIILLHNIVDIAVSIASFGLIGYILAFGYSSWEGIIGYGMWLTSDSADLDNAVLGFSACIMATGIITTILSGRIHFVGYLLTSLLFSMIVQPIIMHWVWHDYGWMHRRNFVGHQVSIKDHAGGLVIHLSGGVVGLIGSLFLGRRLLKLSDIDECSIGADSPGSTITGYIFIALGLIGFSLPSPNYELTHIPHNYIGTVLINNIMAMASGIIIVVILQFLFYRETFNYWIILRCMQGAIAGMVSISAGVDVYTPIFAYIIASAAVIIFFFVAICVYNSSVEDYCNITAIHLVSGFVSTLLPPILGSSENLGISVTSHIRMIHLGWQLLCLFTIAGVLVILFTLLFFLLFGAGFLRNKNEEINHRRGITVAVKGPDRCFLQRLFAIYSETPCIEPGIRGKSADQYHSYQTVNAPSSQRGGADGKFAKQVISQLDESAGTSDTQESYGDELENVLTVKKPRFIYTLPSISTFPEASEYDIDISKCSGDTIKETSFKEDMNFQLGQYSKQNSTDIISYAEMQEPYYELHRTRKHINLCRDRRMIRKKRLQIIQEVSKTNLPRSSECILHDDLYNDGFVTIKMPYTSDGVNLSDVSDN